MVHQSLHSLSERLASDSSRVHAPHGSALDAPAVCPEGAEVNVYRSGRVQLVATGGTRKTLQKRMELLFSPNAHQEHTLIQPLQSFQ